MSRFLIIYGTKYGQAKKIANFISNELTQLGHVTDVVDSRDIPVATRPELYDAVIVGGSVHMHGYPRWLNKWVKHHASTLSTMPSAFFSVCLSALDNGTKVRKEEQKILNTFFIKNDWHPTTWAIFAGELAYSKYTWPLKLIMQWIAKRAGAETSVKQDYEYTNWKDVAQFIKKFIDLEMPTTARTKTWTEEAVVSQ